MFHFRLFRKKTMDFFSSKNPTIFGPLCPFLGETEYSSKFCSYQYFLKKLRPSFTVPKFEEVRGGFQATLVSEARMHTYAWNRRIIKHFMLHIILTLK